MLYAMALCILWQILNNTKSGYRCATVVEATVELTVLVKHLSVGIHENSHEFMGIHACISKNFQEFHGNTKVFPWNSLIFHGFLGSYSWLFSSIHVLWHEFPCIHRYTFLEIPWTCSMEFTVPGIASKNVFLELIHGYSFWEIQFSSLSSKRYI